jgi:hypothetical protein
MQDNTLYPYSFTLKRGEETIEGLSGHASTRGLARKSIEESIRQHTVEGEDQPVLTKFVFDGKDAPINE